MTTLWQSRLMIWAQSLDAATFVLFFALFPMVSIHAERNPIIVMLWMIGGSVAVGLAKVGLSLHIAYSANRERRNIGFRATKPQLTAEFVAIRYFLLSLAVAAGVVGAGFNIAAIVRYWNG